MNLLYLTSAFPVRVLRVQIIMFPAFLMSYILLFGLCFKMPRTIWNLATTVHSLLFQFQFSFLFLSKPKRFLALLFPVDWFVVLFLASRYVLSCFRCGGVFCLFPAGRCVCYFWSTDVLIYFSTSLCVFIFFSGRPMCLYFQLMCLWCFWSTDDLLPASWFAEIVIRAGLSSVVSI